MTTRIRGSYVGYRLLLNDVNKMSDRLNGIGYVLNDLAYFGYDSDAIQNEWNHYNSIKKALDELKSQINKSLHKDGVADVES